MKITNWSYVEMNLPNDITFTYSYLIEHYGSLTLKALGGGGEIFSTFPRMVFGW